MQCRYVVGVSLGLIVYCAAAGAEPDNWKAAFQIGVTAHREENYKKAVEYLEAALHQIESAAIRGTERASVLHFLAIAYQKVGEVRKADAMFQDTLAEWQRAHAEDTAEYAASLSNLAALRQDQSRFDEAESLLLRALAIHRRVLGAQDPRTASSLSRLADVYLMRNDLVRAEQALDQAIAVHQTLPPEDQERLYTQRNLGLLYVAQGRYDRAEATLLEVARRTRASGERSATYAGALGDLGALYRISGDNARALPLLRRTVYLYEQTVGPDHPLTALALCSLGQVDAAGKKYLQAEQEFRRAIGITVRIYGAEQPEALLMGAHLGRIYVDMGKYEQAQTLLSELLPRTRKAYGANHFCVAFCLYSLADAEAKLRRREEAQIHYREAIAIYDDSPGPGGVWLANALRHYADLLRQDHRRDEAKTLEGRANAILQRH